MSCKHVSQKPVIPQVTKPLLHEVRPRLQGSPSPCPNLGIVGALRFLNETVLCRQQGWAIRCLAPSFQEGSKMGGGGGDNCPAIFKVSSSGMVCSGFPLFPTSHPHLPRALFFHQMNFTLGFLKPNLTAFLPFPTPTKSQVATGLGIL